MMRCIANSHGAVRHTVRGFRLQAEDPQRSIKVLDCYVVEDPRLRTRANSNNA